MSCPNGKNNYHGENIISSNLIIFFSHKKKGLIKINEWDEGIISSFMTSSLVFTIS